MDWRCTYREGNTFVLASLDNGHEDIGMMMTRGIA